MTVVTREAAVARHHAAVARLHDVLDKVDELSADLRKEVEDAFGEWHAAQRDLVDAR